MFFCILYKEFLMNILNDIMGIFEMAAMPFPFNGVLLCSKQFTLNSSFFLASFPIPYFKL